MVDRIEYEDQDDLSGLEDAFSFADDENNYNNHWLKPGYKVPGDRPSQDLVLDSKPRFEPPSFLSERQERRLVDKPILLKSMVTRIFQLTDTNQDGFVTLDELKSSTLDKNRTKEDVIILSAIWLTYSRLVQLSLDEGRRESRLSKRDISMLNEALSAGPGASNAVRRTANGFFEFVSFYENKANALSLELFKGEPMPDGAIQPMKVGNCHFVAALSATAAVNPQAIKDMITENNDGTYAVKLPGVTKPITVERPTIGELMWYRTGSSNGMWSTVIQKAYGKYWSPRAQNVLEGAGGSFRNDGLRKLSGGGIDTDMNRFTSYATMDRKLTDAFRERRAVVAGINGEVFGDGRENSTGLRLKHAYAVLNYERDPADIKKSLITLRDPYGHIDWFNQAVPAGIEELGNGKFRMTLERFNKIFSDLSHSKQKP